MEHKSDLAKRTAAFQTLLRDVGEQLGKQNADDIEFFEGIPQDERGKGGIKLLEYLRNRGRFTQWKIEPLREILRKCNRCDLADTLVKKYQLNFVDRGMRVLKVGGAGLTLLCSLYRFPPGAPSDNRACGWQ